MQVRQERAVFARLPSKNVERTEDRIPLVSRLGIHRRIDCPSRSLALIEPEHGANLWVDLQLLNVGLLFGPLHTPPDAADEIAFMKAIPCRGSDFDEQEPAQCGSQKTKEL